MYDDVDLDEDDDGIDPDAEDDEYNEITEAPSSAASMQQQQQSGGGGGGIVPIKNLLPDVPDVSGSVTLHRLLNKVLP